MADMLEAQAGEKQIGLWRYIKRQRPICFSFMVPLTIGAEFESQVIADEDNTAQSFPTLATGCPLKAP